jgi:hypothetical protein
MPDESLERSTFTGGENDPDPPGCQGPTRAISVTAITVKLAVGGTVIERSIHPWRVVMKQLLAAALVGIVIGGIGLAAEAVFAKPISQRGAAMIPQAQSPHVHVLDPIIINGGA